MPTVAAVGVWWSQCSQSGTQRRGGGQWARGRGGGGRRRWRLRVVGVGFRGGIEWRVTWTFSAWPALTLERCRGLRFSARLGE